MKPSVCLTAVLAALLGATTIVAAAPGKGDSWRAARGLPGGNEEAAVRVRNAGGDGDVIELEYDMPELEAVKTKSAGSEEASRLVLGNAPSIGSPGKPVLPVVPCYVVLPAGETLDSVEVVCEEAQVLPGTHAVPHARKSVPLVPGAKPVETPPDPDVYGSDDPWPRSAVKVISVQKKRGVSVLVVNLNPVVYQPKSGKVSLYPRMTLRVRSRKAAETKDDRFKVRYRPDKVRPLSLQVDNPSALTTYREEK